MRKRRFSLSQKIGLFLSSNGVCDLCQTPLLAGWHADHVFPYSRGGETDVGNGQPLCPQCNLKKGDRVAATQIQLRDWQQRGSESALRKYRAGGRVFSVGAGVGSGKTLFGSWIASSLFELRLIDQVIVVSPSETIKRGWAKTMETFFGLSLSAGKGNDHIKNCLPSDVAGYATTYQSVVASSELHRRQCLSQRGVRHNSRTLVIVDEVHHIGMDEVGNQTTWAQSINYAFGEATHILVLTGTPSRTDGMRIPFVEYRDGVAQLDITYSYGRAVDDGVVRMCDFQPVRVDARVLIDEDVVVEASTGAQKSPIRAAVVSEALNLNVRTGNGEYGHGADRILDKAIAELEKIRKHHPRAAGLAVCDGIDHAKYIEAELRARGERCVLVTSEDTEAGDLIREFQSSNAPWIVAVQMVAEGVNIERLRVCAYLTRRRATLTLDQIMGRIVRDDWSSESNKAGEEVREDPDTGERLKPADAVFVHLNNPELIAWSKGVHEEMRAAVREREEEEGRNSGQWDQDESADRTGCFGPQSQDEIANYDVIEMSTADEGSVIRGVSFGADVVELAARVREEIPTLGKYASNLVAALFMRMGSAQSGSQLSLPGLGASRRVLTYQERCDALNEEASTLVNKFCRPRNLPRDQYREMHRWANRQAGIGNLKTASEEQLKAKVEALKRRTERAA